MEIGKSFAKDFHPAAVERYITRNIYGHYCLIDPAARCCGSSSR